MSDSIVFLPLPKPKLTGILCDSSFLAGALPLSFSLSQSQLRLIASLGSGLLVGSCLIVILPEGIEALAASQQHSHPSAQHGPRTPFDRMSARADEPSKPDLEHRHSTSALPSSLALR
jgi:zinc transporter 9